MHFVPDRARLVWLIAIVIALQSISFAMPFADTSAPLCVRAVDSQMLVFERDAQSAPFAFDAVLDAYARQEDVFAASAAPLVEGVLNGIDGTVFAYGATGAGKTHTMVGSVDSVGVMVRATHALFDGLRQRAERDSVRVALRVAYLEVYNEQIRDLLASSSSSTARAAGGGLRLLVDGDGRAVVQGLSFHEPQTAEDVFRLLADGNTRRTQSPTEANAESSRSHAVFQIHVEQLSVSDGERRSACLTLVDLAGSERAAASGNRGKTMREGANINKSLLALGSCINALCSNNAARHVPYRNSKLTRILEHALSGHGQTVMIANISPSSAAKEDTLNTLKYADRAKQIQCSAEANAAKVKDRVENYGVLVAELRAELKRWKSRALAAEQAASANSSTAAAAQPASDAELSASASMERSRASPSKASAAATVSTSSTAAGGNETEISTAVRAALARHRDAAGAARQLQQQERTLMATIEEKQEMIASWTRSVRRGAADPMTPPSVMRARSGPPFLCFSLLSFFFCPFVCEVLFWLIG